MNLHPQGPGIFLSYPARQGTPQTKSAPPASRRGVLHGSKRGANERTRTADLLITSELLYQLSYIGKDSVGTPETCAVLIQY